MNNEMRTKITSLFATMAVLMTAPQMYADTGWVDVTDTYIMNPRFDNNDVSGWWGTQFSISGNSGENGEHYQRLFDSYQDLTGLTPGHYRVSVQAYFRSGSADDDYNHYMSDDPTEYQKVILYASTLTDYQYSLVVLAASGATREDLGGGSGWGCLLRVDEVGAGGGTGLLGGGRGERGEDRRVFRGGG